MITARCKFRPHISFTTPIHTLPKKTIVFGTSQIHSLLVFNIYRSFCESKSSSKVKQRILDDAKNGQLSKAVDSYNALIKDHPPQDVNFYSQFLKYANHSSAPRIWHDMLKNASIGTPTQETIDQIAELSKISGDPILADSVIAACKSKSLVPSPKACNCLLVSYKSSNDVGKAMNLWKEMKSWKVFYQLRFYRALFRLLADAKSKEQALEVYQQMPNSSKTTLAEDLLFIFKNLGCPSVTEELFHMLPNKTEKHYTSVLWIVGTESFDKALQLYSQMSSSNIKPGVVTCTVMLNICRKHNQFNEGLKFYEIVKQNGWMSESEIIQGTVLEFAFNSRDDKLVEEVFSLIPNPNPERWSKMQLFYASRKDWKKTLDCFQHTHPSDSRAYYSAFKAAVALQLPNEVKRIHKQGKENMFPTPLPFTLDAMSAYAKLHMFAQLLSTLESANPKNATMYDLAICSLDPTSFSTAYQLFNTAKSENLILSTNTVCHLLKIVPTLEQAQDIHKNLSKWHLASAHVCQSLMLMYSRFDRPDLVTKVFSQISGHSDDRNYYTIISIMAKHNRHDEVMKIFDEMMQNPKLVPLPSTIYLVLNACTTLLDVSKVLGGVEAHPTLHWKNNLKICGGLLQAYTRIDMPVAVTFWNNIQELLHREVETSIASHVKAKLDPHSPVLVLHRIMMSGYLEAHQPNQAYDLWNKLKTFTNITDAHTVSLGLKIAADLKNDTLGQEAVKIVEQYNLMEDKYLRSVVMLYYAQTHNTEAIEALMQQYQLAVFDYTAIITGCSTYKQPEKAWKVFHQMIERGIQPTIVTMAVLLTALCRGGQLDRAEAMYFGMKQSFGLEPDEKLMRNFCYRLVKGHRWEPALKIAIQLASTEVYLFVMAACRLHLQLQSEDPNPDVARAQSAAAFILATDNYEAHTQAYKILANIYRLLNRHDQQMKIQAEAVKHTGQPLSEEDPAGKIYAEFAANFENKY